MQKKNIAIFGSTGSIGTQTLEVARQFPDYIHVVALASYGNHLESIQKQIEEFEPKIVVIFDSDKAEKLSKRVSKQVKILTGISGLIEMAELKEVDFVLMAMSTTIGMKPTIHAIEAKKTIGLANKEILVSAGEKICSLAREKQILPIDSEHSAIFQCLNGEPTNSIRRIILTASGGPFLHHTLQEMKNISLHEALKHPNWKMGKKITVDSSTMMNKGLEVIEACYLFQISAEQIEVVVHPESIIHSMVEFKDGSIKAQLSRPSMVLPIQYAIFYPDRIENQRIHFDFRKKISLNFEPPDFKRFPCLNLAYKALKKQKTTPCYLNAANEVLVHRFLRQEITWMEIGQKLTDLMERYSPEELVDLSRVFDIECQAKRDAKLC